MKAQVRGEFAFVTFVERPDAEKVDIVLRNSSQFVEVSFLQI